MSLAVPEACPLPERSRACRRGRSSALLIQGGRLCWLQGCDAAAVHEAVGQLQSTLDRFRGSVQRLMDQPLESGAQVRPAIPTRALEVSCVPCACASESLVHSCCAPDRLPAACILTWKLPLPSCNGTSPFTTGYCLQDPKEGSQVLATCSIEETADAASQLTVVSGELKEAVSSNQQLLVAYSQKLLHVQSLATQLAQMQQAGMLLSGT